MQEQWVVAESPWLAGRSGELDADATHAYYHH